MMIKKSRPAFVAKNQSLRHLIITIVDSGSKSIPCLSGIWGGLGGKLEIMRDSTSILGKRGYVAVEYRLHIGDSVDLKQFGSETGSAMETLDIPT